MKIRNADYNIECPQISNVSVDAFGQANPAPTRYLIKCGHFHIII